VGAVAACAHSSDGGIGSAPTAKNEPALDSKIVAVADPRVVPRPLAAYEFDNATVVVLDRARELVANTCMQRFGFAPATSSNPAVDELWSRYGLWDPASADTGYMSPESFNVTSQQVMPYSGDALAVYAGQLKEYKGQAVPAGGCGQEAYRAVVQFDGIPNDLAHFVADLDQEALQRSRQDSRVVPLLEAWRVCMKGHGWDYEDVLSPFEYWEQPPRRGTNKQVQRSDISEEEKSSARDDLGCKRSTGLLGTWLAADIAYQQLIVERESERLREYAGALDKIRANANRIIADGGN
jgi:hypothetical protein